jgi:hypothetical protein
MRKNATSLPFPSFRLLVCRINLVDFLYVKCAHVLSFIKCWIRKTCCPFRDELSGSLQLRRSCTSVSVKNGKTIINKLAVWTWIQVQVHCKISDSPCVCGCRTRMWFYFLLCMRCQVSSIKNICEEVGYNTCRVERWCL